MYLGFTGFNILIMETVTPIILVLLVTKFDPVVWKEVVIGEVVRSLDVISAEVTNPVVRIICDSNVHVNPVFTAPGYA